MDYIKIRKQFGMDIGNMEAIRDKFIDMYMNTWIIHTSVKFTNYILDSGRTPSVIAAIMKQQTTERARNILLNGMDIYAGSGICIGENNFLTKFYNSAPIGITVEGSNTLTRGLMIFGQGINKSHPYIFQIFLSTQSKYNGLYSFKINFNNMIKNIINNYLTLLIPLREFRTNQFIRDRHDTDVYDNNPFIAYNKKLNPSIVRLEVATLKFSILANYIALLGGKIKSKQMISSNMADMLSNLYLGYSLVWYNSHYPEKANVFLSEQCIDYLMEELEYKMNLVIDNYPYKFLKIFMYPLKNNIKYPNFDNKNKLYKLIQEDNVLSQTFKNDIYYKGTVLEKMENLLKMDKNSDEYKNLYQEIISVGEYKI